MSASPISQHSQGSISNSKDESSLDVLVSHLLASKRSLESINKVWRANEIVTAARAALEESVVLQARTGFLRKNISQQVNLLKKVKDELDYVYKDGDKDFRTVLKSLDAANERLQKTMDGLRTTIVESAFRPENEEPRSLLDFVEDSGVRTTQSALKEYIDQIEEARTDFKETITSFTTDIQTIQTSLSTTPSPSSSTLTPPIPSLLHSLELHAHEMANLLDSLVHHFDRCVQVIRHTEGGTLAVKTFTQTHPNDLSISDREFCPGGEENSQTPDPGSLSPEERIEMLDILNRDAKEVEDVVMDIGDRSIEMESQFELISNNLINLRSDHEKIIMAFELLDQIGHQKLPLFILSPSTFLTRYNTTKSLITPHLLELDSMHHFYESYARSYDSLISEVGRRREAEKRVRELVRRCLNEVEGVRRRDAERRAGWREEVEGTLPVDLWEGVGDLMPGWRVVVDEEGEGREAPELRGSVVRGARERLGDD